ncbi:hypothetical protein PANDA_020490 [Ailuropoda melanoleuca]|uniref:Anoctamin dimerisation domain-containing protein n=1 Tax=Ailuropoda melanoleuca TaxID=9646 RepID=D2I4G9_AILME|nr:hypothetical protein PANDA_020490 [Ailuropoda melanoleuca]
MAAPGLRDIPLLPGSPRRLSPRAVARGGQGPKRGQQYLKVPGPQVPGQQGSSDGESGLPSRGGSSCSGSVINNYLDANEPVSSEARLSRMHFHDNQRKVDYVLAYHYRKRGVQPGQGSPGQLLAIVSNGETGKEPHAGGHGDIELGPLDALEEEKKEQREEFEHNLMEAGLELEKDLEAVIPERSRHLTGVGLLLGYTWAAMGRAGAVVPTCSAVPALLGYTVF